jgi:hypothetical protein
MFGYIMLGYIMFRYIMLGYIMFGYIMLGYIMFGYINNRAKKCPGRKKHPDTKHIRPQNVFGSV